MDAYNNVGIDSIETAKNLKKLRIETVSYTHLTLPTNSRV